MCMYTLDPKVFVEGPLAETSKYKDFAAKFYTYLLQLTSKFSIYFSPKIWSHIPPCVYIYVYKYVYKTHMWI